MRQFSGHENAIHSVAFLPDGRHALSCSGGGTAYLWDVESGRPVRRFQRRSNFAIPTSDGRNALSARYKNTVILWDLETNKERVQFSKHESAIRSGTVSPDDRAAVSGGENGILRLWDLKTGEEIRRFQGHDGPVFSVKFTPDGKRIISAGRDATVRVWDVETGREVHCLEGHEGAVFDVAVSPDGRRIATASADATLRIWDLTSGQPRRILRGHRGVVKCVTYSPDGLFLLSGGNDKLIHVWSVQAGIEIQRFAGHSSFIQCVAVSPDGRFALSGSGGARGKDGQWIKGNDFTVRLWRLPTLDSTATGQIPTIAVFGFTDEGPSVQLAPLRIALAEMLTTRLGQYQGLQCIERARVDAFLEETGLGESGLVDAATAQRAGQALVADYLLSGTFSGRDGRIVVQAVLQRVGATEPVQQWTFQEPVEKLFHVEHELARGVLEAMGLKQAELRSAPHPDPGPSPTVAILALRNVGPTARLTPMETGFAEILQAQLSMLDDVRLVERQKLYDILSEQELSAAQLTDPRQAIRIGRLLGAERLVYGSFLELGETFRIDVRIADTQTASVLTGEFAAGKTRDFSELLEELALKIAAGLSVEPPPDAARRIRQGTPVRKIEAALHYARGERAFYQGRYRESAESFERVLLVEPDNPRAGLGRTRAWFSQKSYGKAIAAGQQALAQTSGSEHAALRQQVYQWLAKSYWYAKRYDDYVQLAKKVQVEFPQSSLSTSPAAQLNLAFALMYSDREDDGRRLLEKAVDREQVGGDPELYGKALRTLHQYHYMAPMYITRSREYEDRRKDPEYAKQIARETKQRAERAVQIFRKILEFARNRRENAWRFWAQSWIANAPNVTWFDPQGKKRYLLSEGERLDLLTEALDAFQWEPKACWKGHEERAQLSERLGQWNAAIESYRYVLEHPEGAIRELAPSSWDLSHLAPTSNLDQRINALYQIAAIQHRTLNRPRRALRTYQQVVERFGLTHFRGAEVVQALTELGKEPQFPEQAALVWGGTSAGQQAWQKLLKPMGIAVHPANQYQISAAHLAPYSLVILVRPGRLPYEPADILALRSYVATGGSLLVVVSPGWEHAAPGIHNPLLALFGAHAGQDMAVRAHSTRIAPHEITTGVSKAMAKNSVHLDVPAESVLIEAGDRTVLAAVPYRHGHVVLASFAQWFEPDPDYPSWMRRRSKNGHWTKEIPAKDRPIETGSNLQLPLLRKVVEWLHERGRSGTSHPQRRLLSEAWQVSRDIQFQAVPREELQPALERLLRQVESGFWTEEALWAAGEASMHLFYFPDSKRIAQPTYSWQMGHPPDPEPRYYRRLLDEFPDSPLHPYAQWRFADATSRVLRNQHSSRAGRGIAFVPESAIRAFQKVAADDGSGLWAWRELRLGTLRLQSGETAEALPHFLRVAERMENGPEKVLGMMNAAVCYEVLDKSQEARRYSQAVLDVPAIFWWSSSPFAAWGPLDARGTAQTGTSHRLAQKRLQ